jgi:hypothetical protein
MWTRILPPAPSRLLLLGATTGTLVAELEALGYQVGCHALSPAQEYAQHPTITRQGVYQVSLVLPDALPQSFGAAVVLNFSWQVHPLALWDQLAQWLEVGALVVLVGPWDEALPSRVRNWQAYVAAIGARCGFTAVELAQDSITCGPGTSARAFRKTATPRWKLRHMRHEDFAEIAVLFQEVFGQPLSRELWDWKYANGHGNAVLASRDGTLIAHYGGMYREILLCGKPEWAYGGTDVMVHPKERGVMTRQGPFQLISATTAEMYGPVAFGFPTERHMVLAEKMGLYTKAERMVEMRWAPAASGFRVRSRVRALIRGNVADQAMTDHLWGVMAHDLRDGVVGMRDWTYLERRFWGHPHNHYEVLGVTSRLTGKPLGVMVLRRLETTCELLDVIAPLANMALIVDQARRMTALWGLTYLYCWTTTNHAPLFVACGGKEEALNVFVPTSCWTDDPRVNMLKDKWWLTSGDTDFR